MRKFVSFVALSLLLSIGVFGQSTTPSAPVPATSTFTVTANAVTLPGNTQTLAGTLAGMNLRITPNFNLHQINLLS